MIDFRYHLVSLISVFLALAVGVVLGAGPLQNSLGTALTDQVTSLREDRNATHAQLEQTEAAVNDRDSYITASAAAFLPGTLKDRKVALVLMPGADKDDVEAVTTQLGAAGASVVGQVTLTTAWIDTARDTFRSTYAGQFAGYMSVPDSAAGNTVLGMGLAQALTGSGTDATALLDLLTASDTPLVSMDAQPSAQADSLVIVGARTTAVAGSDPSPAPTAGVNLASWNDAMAGAASQVPTVVVGAAGVETDLVAQLRAAKVKVTTVDSVGQAAAAVSAPLALAATINGTQDAYGFDDGASAVMPPVTAASAPEATPSAPASPAESETGQ